MKRRFRMSDDLDFLLLPTPEELPKASKSTRSAISPERMKFIWNEARNAVVVSSKGVPKEPAQEKTESLPGQPQTLKQKLEAWAK